MDQAFFAKARTSFGPFLQTQVDCINAICDLAQRRGSSLPHVAYLLATAWEEARLVPKDEYGKGAGHAYGLPTGPYHQAYYGRGFQLTWQKNYAFATQRLRWAGVLQASEDLERNPDLVNRPDVASACLVYGMEEGWYTKFKLSDFTSYVDMRQVYNGHDRADLIASYALKWEMALKASQTAFGAVFKSAPPPPQNPLGALISALLSIFKPGSGASGPIQGETTMLQGKKTYTLGTAVISVLTTLLGMGWAIPAAATIGPTAGIGGILASLAAIFLRSGISSSANTVIDNVVAQVLDGLVGILRQHMPSAADLVAGLEPTLQQQISDEIRALEARLLAANGAAPIAGPLPK